jgi:hypothetical protein
MSRQQIGLPVNGGPESWEGNLTDITIVELWFRITAAAANALFPIGKPSPVLMPSLLFNGWSSMRLSFYGITYDPD